MASRSRLVRHKKSSPSQGTGIKRTGQATVVKNTTVKPSANVVNQTVSQPKWKRDSEINANLLVNAEVFTTLMKWFSENSSREIGGYYSIGSDRKIGRLFLTDKGSGSEVVFQPKNVAAVVTKMQETNEYIGGNWHTHPGFGPFWSATDLAMMASSISEDLMFGPRADYSFLVFDPPNFITRRIIIEDGVLDNARYNDGLLWLEGSSNPLPGERPKILPKTTRTYATSWYVNEYQDFDDDVFWGGYTYGAIKDDLVDATADLFMDCLERKDLFGLLEVVREIDPDQLSSILFDATVVPSLSEMLGYKL